MELQKFLWFLGAVRLRVRLGISQRCLNGRDHITRDARFGLSQVTRGCCRGCRFVRGADHAATHGGWCVRHGGVNRNAYTGIMAAAFLQRFFFVAVWVGINAYALAMTYRLATELLPSKRTVLITTGFFVIPFAVLLERMFVGGFTPQYAACVAILVGAVLLFVDSKLSWSWRRTGARLENVCLTAGRQIGTIAAIILCASLVIGVLGQTGLGVKITSVILSGSGGALWPHCYSRRLHASFSVWKFRPPRPTSFVCLWQGLRCSHWG